MFNLLTDKKIIDLYFNRNEQAIKETDRKYGRYCFSVANHISYNQSDSEECVNDTYLEAWTHIPPTIPENLKIYLSKITRNLALNIYEKFHTQKRGHGEVPIVLDELSELVGKNQTEETFNETLLTESIDAFLKDLPKEKRKIFVLRYWHLYSIKEIAKTLNLSESNIKMSLSRTRDALQDYLIQGGFDL